MYSVGPAQRATAGVTLAAVAAMEVELVDLVELVGVVEDAVQANRRSGEPKRATPRSTETTSSSVTGAETHGAGCAALPPRVFAVETVALAVALALCARVAMAAEERKGPVRVAC